MFVGRNSELSALEEAYRDERAQLVVVFGRRRIGKTELLKRFCKGKHSLISQASEGGLMDNRKALSRDIAPLLGYPKGYEFSSYRDYFEAVQSLCKEERFVLVIDEVPLLAQSDKTFLSDLQWAIDHAFNEKIKPMVVLSGSSVKMMKKILTDKESPLYKRETMRMELRELRLNEAVNFTLGMEEEKRLLILESLGNDPFYLDGVNLNQDFDSILKEAFFNPRKRLFDVPKSLLGLEVEAPAVYSSILSAIAHGHIKTGDIAERLGKDSSYASPYLSTLLNLGIIETRQNYLSGNRGTYYAIKDRAWCFYYRFIYNHKSEIDMNFEAYYEETKPLFASFFGKRFEEVCIDFLEYLNANRLLPRFYSSFYTYSGRSPRLNRNLEIDGILLREKKALFVECKDRNEPQGEAEENRLIESSNAEAFDGLDKDYLLISRSGFKAEHKKKEGILYFDLKDMFSVLDE